MNCQIRSMIYSYTGYMSFIVRLWLNLYTCQCEVLIEFVSHRHIADNVNGTDAVIFIIKYYIDDYFFYFYLRKIWIMRRKIDD